MSSAASSGATGGGTVSAAYQINTGPGFAVPLTGWGAGSWGSATWGIGQSSVNELRTWNQSNFGEDLVFGPSGGRIYFWDSGTAASLSTRAVDVSSLSGASDVPTVQNIILVSDNRFVFCFGVNEVGSSSLNPMHVRWSDQEKVADWTPSEISQSAGLTLSLIHI